MCLMFQIKAIKIPYKFQWIGTMCTDGSSDMHFRLVHADRYTHAVSQITTKFREKYQYCTIIARQCVSIGHDVPVQDFPDLYSLRRLIDRSREVSEPRDWML